MADAEMSGSIAEIVQLARIHRAGQHIATARVLSAVDEKPRHEIDELEAKTSRLKAERSSLPKTIGNSRLILELNRQIEEQQIEVREL